jgi:nickel/cobalt transporter (NicO) family protein
MLPAMGPLTELLQSEAAAAWLLLPSALVLGVLHSLEGHSKTMMTAFIVAVRRKRSTSDAIGVRRDDLAHFRSLGCGPNRHAFGNRYDGAVAEPYFQMASAVLIIAIAL